MVTHVLERLDSRGQIRLYQKGRGPRAPNFWISYIRPQVMINSNRVLHGDQNNEKNYLADQTLFSPKIL